MSYSGTVHCSFCGARGHNRLGCPERRKEALKDPDGYVGRVWHREQAQRKERVANRVCSYCKKPGHNRRGCKLLKEDRSLIERRQSEYRQHFLEVTSSAGLHAGSLVRVLEPGSQNVDKGFLALVTGINWQHVDFLLADTDLSYGWRARERPLMSLRVVSTFGYTDDDNYWNSEPKFNDVKFLQADMIKPVVPELFLEGVDFNRPGFELVSPSKAPTTPVPSDIDFLTQDLDSAFNLRPGSRANDYEKQRTALFGQQWRMIRPDEHSAAVELRQS